MTMTTQEQVQEIREFLLPRLGADTVDSLCDRVGQSPTRGDIMSLIGGAACECADRGIDLSDHTLSSWGGRLATQLGAQTAAWCESNNIATYILWELIDDINSRTKIYKGRRVIPQVVMDWRNSRVPSA